MAANNLDPSADDLVVVAGGGVDVFTELPSSTLAALRSSVNLRLWKTMQL